MPSSSLTARPCSGGPSTAGTLTRSGGRAGSARPDADPDDEVLLRAWAGGDQASGAVLYRRHFAALHRFFRTKAADAPEDLIQITMLECLRCKDRFRAEAPFRGFLFGVARNCLLHHLRSRARDRLDFDASRSSVADLVPRPSTVLAHHDAQAQLVEAMQALPVDLQIVLELHYWEELSTRELSEALQVPQGTVKSRLRRAREALRDTLAAVGGPSPTALMHPR